jgi:Zn-dependent M28 family amino/carboxypeptidase
MHALGLANVHTEPVSAPHWERGDARALIVSPGMQPMAVVALGGSVATPDAGLEADVVMVHSLDELNALAPEAVRGRIVFVHRVMPRSRDGHGYGETVTVRTRAPSLAARKGAVAVLIRSVGTDATRAPHTGQTRYEQDAPRIPAAALSVADADMLERITVAQASRGAPPPRVRLALACRTLENTTSANVIGEVLGRDRNAGIVLLGAHLDAWDLGTGALDDGAGVAIVLSTAHAIAQQPAAPRRTVRVVLFANEENGLAGARAYASSHERELARHDLALEADAGDGRVYEARFEGTPEARARFMNALASLRGMGVHLSDEPAHGGADLSPLAAAGVPRVDLAQDLSRYFDLHHTANDTPAALDARALDQAVAVWTAAVTALARYDGDFGRAAVSAR